MPERFDLIVIGTGVAASTVAHACRKAGWSVAVADSRPYGGTCANRGCDPKKVLVGAADVVDWARRMSGRGVRAADLRIDWQELMRFKHSFTDPVPASREQGFIDAGIRALHGVARFTGPDTLDVDGEPFAAEHFVIAAGAAPVRLRIPGEDLLINSDQFLDLEYLPESLIFVGGGYIAFEFAHLAARAGSRVTILHRGARPLEHFDADLVDQLVAHSRRVGITVQLNSAVEGVDSSAEGVRVTASTGKYEAMAAVHAAGRKPPLDALNLPAAGVETTRDRIKLNGYLQSVSNPRVYAAGDAAAAGPALTPVATYHGNIVTANLLHGNREQPEYLGYASTVFSIPPLSSVGLTEATARAQGLDIDVRREVTSGWYSSRRIAEESSGYKVLTERKTGKIVGAHILGTGADELINVFSLAIRNGLTAAQVRAPLYAYPTHGSNISYMV